MFLSSFIRFTSLLSAVLLCLGEEDVVVHIRKKLISDFRHLWPCEWDPPRQFVIERLVANMDTLCDCLFLDSTSGNLSFECRIVYQYITSITVYGNYIFIVHPLTVIVKSF